MFLKGPDYSAHPYASQWLAALDKEKPDVTIFEKNIRIYRACKKERTKTYQAHLRHEIKSGGSIWETVFHLGPPGSEEDIVEYPGKGDAQAQTASASVTRKRKAGTAVAEVTEGSGGPRKGSGKRNAVAYRDETEDVGDYQEDEDGEFRAPSEKMGRRDDDDSDFVKRSVARKKFGKSGKLRSKTG